ncbi:MAG: alpha/beta fold hydrolase [Planctomycetes bacterium]|nr:alpha/beta fold hydrolase [Planctomycetota bacterium]MCC7171618.1 alpha/beta fold hydrolase [Planctomycetota bacterium]
MIDPRPRGHRVRVPGTDVELAVDDWGPVDAAPRATALFLPGFGSVRSGSKATRIGRALAARGARMLALDYEGHGDSSGAFATMSVSRHLRDAFAVIAAMAHSTPLTLIGSSLGGLVAARAAAKLQPHVERLALIAPAFGFRERFEHRLGGDALGHWERTNVLRYSGEFFSAELAFDLLRDARTLDEDELARAIEVPTLLVHGSADATVPLECSEHVARVWQAPLRFVRFDGGDHRLESFIDPLTDLIAEFVVES